MKAYRASLLWFESCSDGPAPARFEQDGLLVLARDARGVWLVEAIGNWHTVAPQYPQLPVEHLPGRIIAPGFVDLHVHFPQTNVIGAPADGLLPWLENYTFPEEQRFADPQYAADSAVFFLRELRRNGVTSALAFSTSHLESVHALFTQALADGMRVITGLCLMDRNAPAALCNRPGTGGRDATEQSLLDSEMLLQRWHGQGRLGYAITPRFAPTSSAAQLHGAGELARAYPQAWVQSHVAENRDEVAWVRRLFPAARSYLSTYADFGLLHSRSVYAHCIYFDDDDRALMCERGAAAAVSPTSNLFLGSGFFDYVSAQRAGLRYGLASDVGGGTSFSPFHTMLGAYYVGREGQTKQGTSLSPQHLWWQHSAGAGQLLGIDNAHGQPLVGNLLPGCEADLIVLNPTATPLLARKTALADSLDALLFALIVLGDDRLVERTVLAQDPAP